MKLDKPISSVFEIPVKLSAQASLSEEQLKLAKKAFASVASDHLSKYIVDVDVENNPDLLPVAFDSCIDNLVNGNDDAITSQSILELAKTSKYKYINYEHDRCSVIGHILNYGFHSFSDKSEMSEEDVANSSEPFYLSLGGVVWKIVDKYTSEAIENQSSGNMSHAYTVHASWEVTFSEFVLATGSKRIKDAVIIDSDEEIKKLEKYLRINGGSGYLPDGRPVYRLITDPKPLFMGIGFTYNPAASVSPIITKDLDAEDDMEDKSEDDNESTSKASIEEKDNILDENLNNFSQKDKNTVKAVSMKLTEINDINEDSLKEAIASKTSTASEIREFIKTKLQEKDAEISQTKLSAEAEKQELLNEKQRVADDLATAASKVSSLEESIITLQGELATIRNAQEAEEKERAFSSRMSEIESEYNLDDANVKSIVASKIKALASDEDFTAWKTEFALLGVGLKKQSSQSASSEDAASKALALASANGSKIPVGVQSGQQTTTNHSTKVEVSPKGFVTI